MTVTWQNDPLGTVASASEIQKLYCLYDLHWHDPEQGAPVHVYTGFCRMVDVFTHSDAKSNSEYIRLIRPSHFIYIRVVATGEKNDVYSAWSKYWRKLSPQPVFNVKGHYRTMTARPIICSNGSRFESQSDACRALNLSQGQLSSHLQGKPTYKSVKGLTFWYEGN